MEPGSAFFSAEKSKKHPSFFRLFSPFSLILKRKEKEKGKEIGMARKTAKSIEEDIENVYKRKLSDMGVKICEN